MPRVIFYLLLSLALLAGYAKYIELRAVFFPTQEIEFTPQDAGLRFEDVYIEAADGVKINGWFIPASGAKYTLLFLHGNAGNIGHRIEKLKILKDIGVNILIIDYRGYGRSQGRPSEKGIYLDARAAYDYLLDSRKIPADEVILYGESLGTTAAIELASKCKLRAVILEGAFSRGRDIAEAHYPFLPGFLFAGKFDSLSKIGGIEAAKLFLHSRNDEIVPFALAQKLFARAKEPKYFAEIPGNHNDAFMDAGKQYISDISGFIKGL